MAGYSGPVRLVWDRHVFQGKRRDFACVKGQRSQPSPRFENNGWCHSRSVSRLHYVNTVYRIQSKVTWSEANSMTWHLATCANLSGSGPVDTFPLRTNGSMAANGRLGIWFIDKVAALMALTRGRTRKEQRDAMVSRTPGSLAGEYMVHCLPYGAPAISSGCRAKTTGRTVSAERGTGPMVSTSWSCTISHLPLAHAPPAALPHQCQGLSLRLSALDAFSALDGVLPRGECQMSDDTRDAGRFSNQST